MMKEFPCRYWIDKSLFMRFLIVYSSMEGHTKKIADFLADEIKTREHEVKIQQVSPGAVSPEQYDAVVIAASIHAGQYANELVDYVTRHSSTLNHMPGAFYSIGLSVTSKDPEARKQLRATTASFLEETTWDPFLSEQVAGALLYTQYGFIKRMLVRSIMKKAGGDTDTSRDYIYTDWNALRLSLNAFIGHFELATT